MTPVKQLHLPTLIISGRRPPPGWAVRQRELIRLMDRAAEQFVERYTRSDGTLIWREAWPGMDGSDDAYESFVTFPLLSMLGGGKHLDTLARREWNALTWQFTRYGQVYHEFDAYYDWMHHGESYTYLHYLALSNPDSATDRERTLQFAAMYIGEDPAAPNWDPDRKMIRSPITGSRGPRFEMTAEDWVTHRPILAHYLSPYEDVPGCELDDPLGVLDWNDDETFEKILRLMNERMASGDVPLNLNATSLITSAYLYTGDDRYRQWVLDYLEAWQARTARNNGIVPDNVGPTGEIGERMGGRWWGGYYGWRWPHGAWIILESTLIAGSNALLLTGDDRWLDLHRSQGDLLWSLRREEGGTAQVPYRHGQVGWFDYRPPRPEHYAHLYFLSRRQEDLARFDERFPRRQAWYSGPPSFGKAGHFGPERWFGYILGENPDFPEQVLDDTYACMLARLDKIGRDDLSQIAAQDIHHWQDLNPVVPEGLIQMAMGTPAAIYHGGILHASVRYFDPQGRRSGLPQGVAALVEKITPQGIVLTLVNTDPLAGCPAIVQAGGFAEHEFTTLRSGDGETQPVGSPWLRVELGPSAQARLELGIRRFARRPTYALGPF